MSLWLGFLVYLPTLAKAANEGNNKANGGDKTGKSWKTNPTFNVGINM